MSAPFRALWIGALAFAACQGSPPAEPGPPASPADSAVGRDSLTPAPASGRLRTSAGSWELELRAEPSPPPLNEPFDLRVWVYDAEGALRTDVELAVDADMPAHRHGMLREPRLRRLADGATLAEGLLFHMPGEWVLFLDVGAAGITERAELPVVLE